MDLGIAGKVAIITGSARGIGAAIAHRLAAEGVRVVVTDINADAASEFAGSLAEQGFDALAVGGDVTNGDDVRALVETTVDHFDGIHILVNNAGFPRDGRITSMTDDDWDSVIAVILRGAFLTSRAVMPHFVEQKWGRIVNISSRAYLGNPGQANYSAAKAGILGLTRALAHEEGRFGITINSVVPGFIETDLVRRLDHFAKIRDKALAATPLRRTGSPDNIADAVAFLASERADYITGEAMHVTGGRYG